AHPLPFAHAACAHPSHWVQDALGVINLVKSCGSLGTIPPAATRMRRIPFEFPDTAALLIHVGKQSASRLAVETDSRNQSVVLFNFSGPLGRIILSPVVPAMRGWKAGKTA